MKSFKSSFIRQVWEGVSQDVYSDPDPLIGWSADEGRSVVSQDLTFSIFRLQESWGWLPVDGHQVINLFHLVGGFMSAKQLQKFSSNTII